MLPLYTGRCLQTLAEHPDWIFSVFFCPDSWYVVSGSQDGMLKCWDVQKGECIQTLIALRPYEEMNITKIQGLNEAQKA